MRFKTGPDEFIPLDNAALIYPPTQARYNSNVFRISMDLDIPVEPQRLLKALQHTMVRFPYYAVSLHHGFFWYYLSPHNKPLKVYPDRSYPCAYFHRKKSANGYLFKVLYRDYRIAVECFHSLTDGTGALILLKSLVAQYLKLSGIAVGEDSQIFIPGSPIGEEESADSFQTFFKPLRSVFESDVAAFHLKSSQFELTDHTQVISAIVDVDAVKKAASVNQATITEYFVAELIDAFQRVQQQTVSSPKRYKPIRISVPVNIRKIFGSTSMRNFTLFVVVGIDPRLGEYTFAEIIEQVRYQIRNGVNSKSLSRQISRNVAGGRNILIRYAPNFLKGPIMKILSERYGDRLYSSTISNLGALTLPSGMSSHVTRADFYLSPSKSNKVSLAVVGANGRLYLNFSSVLVKRTDIEREFLSTLVAKGIPVEVASNRDELL
ncbi:MAG: hypothetical protein WCR91_08710 [Sphaerochaetaceae bacterium]